MRPDREIPIHGHSLRFRHATPESGSSDRGRKRFVTAEILLVHRVLPAAERPAGPGVAPSITPEQFEALLIERVDWSKPSPDCLFTHGQEKSAFVIAVDGAYRDFDEHVLPLLERHGVHCVLFVVSDWAKGVRGPYEAALGRALRKRSRVEIPVEGFVELRGDADRERAFEALRRLYKPLPTAEREGLVAALGADPCDVEADVFLGADRIRELATHPLVTIGSMGRTHAFLPRLRSERLAADIAQGKRELETWIGTNVEWFAYPHGAYNQSTRRCVQVAGFRFACGMDPGGVETDLTRAPQGAVVERRARDRGFDIDRVDRLALPRTEVTRGSRGQLRSMRRAEPADSSRRSP
jgi:peptidoglycan/xylan/chitin deacetylase (PgdA/CDA1 family)